METAECLVDVAERYASFLKAASNRTSNFQHSRVKPTVIALKQLIDMFKRDMNRVVFLGLNRAMEQIDIVFGPNRDTMDFFIGRVIRNSKLVSLHANNLVQYGYRYERLDELLRETIQYARVVEETLPRYYMRLTDVPETMKKLKFNYDVFVFPPLRLAEVGDECETAVETFKNETSDIRSSLEQISVMLDNSTEDAMAEKLKHLYSTLHHYGSEFEQLKNNCFEQFVDAVGEMRKFNATYLTTISDHVTIQYSFDFKTESQGVTDNYSRFGDLIQQYLEFASITKFQLQDNLTEDSVNQLISTQRAFIATVKTRLTERLRRRIDKARVDVTTWYTNVLEKAQTMVNYMPPNFLEERIGKMEIWQAPIINPFYNTRDHLNFTCELTILALWHCSSFYIGCKVLNIFCLWFGIFYIHFIFSLTFTTDLKDPPFSDSVNTDGWGLSDFLSDRGLETLQAILVAAFEPMNRALDDYDKELNGIENYLSSALKEVRNLMKTERTKDTMNENYVL